MKKSKEQKKEYQKEYYELNKEKSKEYQKEWYESNKEKIKKYRELNREKMKEYHKEYRELNREKSKEYRELNREKMKEWNREYHKKRYRSDLKYRLNSRISIAIGSSLKGGKKGRHWETLVDYTLDELRKYLESKFKKDMTWDNYGKWHIDHLIPISAFNFSLPKHIDFKRCWDLSNLQPLWAKENWSKGSKLSNPFQLSLEV